MKKSDLSTTLLSNICNDDNCLFCHSGLDPESSIYLFYNYFWIPACAGMTVLGEKTYYQNII